MPHGITQCYLPPGRGDLGSLITEGGECTTEFRTWLNRGQAIEASLHKYGKVTAYRFQRRYDYD